MADLVLDAKGMTCPIPVMKAASAIRQVPPGGLLEVLATDPGASEDMRVFCKTKGHELVSQEEDDGVLVFLIRRAE